MEAYLEVGEIVNTHGVRGEVRVIPLTDDPQRFRSLDWVFLDREGSLDKIYIEGVKYARGMVILKFKNIDDPASAETLKGRLLKVDREHAVKLPEGSYFICDLLGSEVFDETAGKLGELKDIIKTGSNDVYVVRNETGREVLVPALKSVVRNISLENRKITVALPEGLLEDEV